LSSAITTAEDDTALKDLRLPYQPELDGIRGLAVSLVLVFHTGVSWLPGGYVGVSVFFTLSGFLITRLLITEFEITDGVRLGNFWIRRFRRLIPASLLCLMLVWAAAMFGLLPTMEHLQRDVWSAIFQVFNWAQLASDQSYTELLTGAPGALDHYWSLAIEEQFYWVWPLVVVLLARRQSIGIGIAGITGAAFLAAPLIAVFFGADAAYWATPARAGEILAGCTLAVLVQHRPSPMSVIGTPIASIGLFVIILCAVTWPTESGPAYSGWAPVFSIASVALIWGSSSGPASVLLSSRGLVAVGGLSYGLYLYHWPVYIVISSESTGWDRWLLTFVRLAVTSVIAILSYTLLEQPIRRGRLTDRALFAGVGGFTVLLLLGSIAITPPTQRFTVSNAETFATSPQPRANDSLLTPLSTELAVQPDVPIARGAPPIEDRLTSTPELTSPSLGEKLLLDAIQEELSLVEPPPSRPVRVLVTGDSTAWAMADGLNDWADRNSDWAEVRRAVGPGCGFLRADRLDPDEGNFLPFCEKLMNTLLPDAVEAFLPDLVLAMVSVADLEEFQWNETEAVLAAPDERFAAHMRADYQAFADDLVKKGARGVVFVKGPRPAVNIPRHRHDDSWRPGRMEMQHDVMDDIAVADSNVEVLDVNRWYLASEFGAEDSGRSDGVHFDDVAAIVIAKRLIGPWTVAVALNRAAE
jgi:peptidoglycan/LPS O-acetylase OafA/YrhL